MEYGTGIWDRNICNLPNIGGCVSLQVSEPNIHCWMCGVQRPTTESRVRVWAFCVACSWLMPTAHNQDPETCAWHSRILCVDAAKIRRGCVSPLETRSYHDPPSRDGTRSIGAWYLPRDLAIFHDSLKNVIDLHLPSLFFLEFFYHFSTIYYYYRRVIVASRIRDRLQNS